MHWQVALKTFRYMASLDRLGVGCGDEHAVMA